MSCHATLSKICSWLASNIEGDGGSFWVTLLVVVCYLKLIS